MEALVSGPVFWSIERVGTFLRRLGRDRGGASALEFALLLPVFLWLLMGILETSVMLHTQVVVEGAVADAARQIRTGQAQQSGDAVTTFQNQLCGSLNSVIGCNELTYDVRTSSSFATITWGFQEDEEGETIPPVFTPGNAGDIVVVTVQYTWRFFTPMIGAFYGDNHGMTRTIMATAVFRNEPYDTSS
jgi:Flp pilus assembly protein TadG